MGTGKKGDQPPIAPTIGHTHFAATGRYFYDLTELSKMRIPVISIVFGSSTAGGAYQPKRCLITISLLKIKLKYSLRDLL